MSHKDSKLTARGRLAMVKRLERGESGRAVAADLGLAVSKRLPMVGSVSRRG
jgi:hypothetical protein